MHHLRKANPNFIFLLVAFGVPWSVQFFMAFKRIPLLPIWPGLIVANGFCSVAGFVAAYCESGQAGVVELGRRCIRYRAPTGWWLYSLLLCFAIANVAAFAYGLIRGDVGPLKLQGLGRQWWLPVTLLFGFFFGPLGEEVGWRGYLLPSLLRQYSPLLSSSILGLIAALWHFPEGLIVGSPSYFHSVVGLLLFTVSVTCMSTLTTILVLHTRMSVLHAMVFHWSVLPAVEISKTVFPVNQEPPDWVRSIALIAFTLVATVIFRKQLTSGPLAHPTTS